MSNENIPASPKQPKDTAWGKEDLPVLEDFDKPRGLVLRAMGRLVNATLRPYFTKGARALEIGSGTGFMRRAFTSEEGSWTQLEPSPELGAKAKQTSPKSDEFVTGSVYELPFEDNTMDLITGWASFDVFDDVDKALQEVKRVLKPEGVFVHFLDVGTNKSSMTKELLANKMRFRTDGGGHSHEQHLIIPKTKDPQQKAVRNTFVFKGFSDEVDLNASFNKRLKAAVERNGLKVVRAGLEYGAFIGKRTPEQEEFDGVGAFYHGEGKTAFRQGYMPTKDLVSEDTGLLILVAKKPK